MKAMLCVSAISAILMSFATLRAEDNNPKPAPLMMLSAASVKEGKLTGITTQIVTTYTTQIVTKIVRGQTVTETVIVPVVQTKDITIEYSLENTKATTVDGKAIAAADLAAMVKGAKVVAVFPAASKPAAEAVKKMPEGTVLIEMLAEKK